MQDSVLGFNSPVVRYRFAAVGKVAVYTYTVVAKEGVVWYVMISVESTPTRMRGTIVARSNSYHRKSSGTPTR